MSRRRLVRSGAFGATLALLAACGDDSVPSRVDPPTPSIADAGAGGAPEAGATFVTEQTWYLERDATTVGTLLEWTREEGVRATLTIGRSVDGALVGQMSEGDRRDDVDAIELTADMLAFRRRTKSGWQHYRLRTTDGAAVGRWAATATGEAPPLASYEGHVTGWNAESFPLSGRALSWDIAFGNGARARIRISRGDDGAWIGRFKVYAGPLGELLEEDATNVTFDGSRLSFEGPITKIDAVADGRTLSGSVATSEGSTSIRGARSALASFGIAPRGDREAWQAVTRRRITALMMNGALPPAAPCTATLGDPGAPRAAVDEIRAERDDDYAAHPQAYSLSELTLSCPMTNAFDGRPIAAPRIIHGWVAVPNAPAPAEGRPVVLAMNGHNGNALSVMSPDAIVYHYGDAFARRDYLVVAIDIKHHPEEPVEGEDGTHPPIVGDGFTTTDWEEDGERAWDLRRASDWIFARSDIDPKRALVTGLSMGGELTTLTAGLDERWKMALPAGYSPDMDVLLHMPGHNCWQWRNADIREWVDQSDLEALIAPRPLLVEVGRTDDGFSARKPHFSGDFQVMRRTRVAWTAAEQTRLALYLHFDEHAYHFGDRRAGESVGLGVTVVPAPSPSSASWQTDETTTTLAPTIFDVIDAWLP